MGSAEARGVVALGYRRVSQMGKAGADLSSCVHSIQRFMSHVLHQILSPKACISELASFSLYQRASTAAVPSHREIAISLNAGMPQAPVSLRLDSELMQFKLQGWQTARGFTYLHRPLEATMHFTPALGR